MYALEGYRPPGALALLRRLNWPVLLTWAAFTAGVALAIVGAGMSVRWLVMVA